MKTNVDQEPVAKVVLVAKCGRKWFGNLITNITESENAWCHPFESSTVVCLSQVFINFCTDLSWETSMLLISNIY